MINLTSHNYPNAYPSNAYVLWTFQSEPGVDSQGLAFRLLFGYMHLQSGDNLSIGRGWDPNNTVAIVQTFYGYYSGYPSGLSVSGSQMFVEFSTDSSSEGRGFQITMELSNITGILRTVVNL